MSHTIEAFVEFDQPILTLTDGSAQSFSHAINSALKEGGIDAYDAAIGHTARDIASHLPAGMSDQEVVDAAGRLVGQISDVAYSGLSLLIGVNYLQHKAEERVTR